MGPFLLARPGPDILPTEIRVVRADGGVFETVRAPLGIASTTRLSRGFLFVTVESTDIPSLAYVRNPVPDTTTLLYKGQRVFLPFAPGRFAVSPDGTRFAAFEGEPTGSGLASASRYVVGNAKSGRLSARTGAMPRSLPGPVVSGKIAILNDGTLMADRGDGVLCVKEARGWRVTTARGLVALHSPSGQALWSSHAGFFFGRFSKKGFSRPLARFSLDEIPQTVSFSPSGKRAFLVTEKRRPGEPSRWSRWYVRFGKEPPKRLASTVLGDLGYDPRFFDESWLAGGEPIPVPGSRLRVQNVASGESRWIAYPSIKGFGPLVSD